jgi:hypothetical protein
MEAIMARTWFLRIIFITVLACAVISPSYAQKAKKGAKQPPPPTSVSLPDKTVETELGTFEFTNLALGQPETYGIKMPWLNLTGTATNKTTRKWISVFFDFEFIGGNGNPVYTVHLHYLNLESGQSTRLGLMESGEMVDFSNTGQPTGGFRIKYVTGEIDIPYEARMQKPSPSNSGTFEDSSIRVTFALHDSSFSFSLQNKTDSPIRIDWNQVSFIDPGGTAHAVTHDGVKYADASSAKPPTVVPPLARVSDSIVPADNVHFESGEYGGWRTNHLLPHTPKFAGVKDIPLGIYMPLEIKGSTKDLSFTFNVSDPTLSIAHP